MKVLIIFCLLIIILSLYYSIVYEKYTNFPLLVYKVELNPKFINIYVDNFDYSDKVINYIKDIKNLNIKRNTDILQEKNNLLILTDTFTYNFSYNNNKILTIANDDKYALFMKSKDTFNNETLNHVVSSNKIIGYYNIIDSRLITYLCISLDIDVSQLKLKKLDYINNSIINKDYFTNNNIDILFIFTSLTNTEFISTIDNYFLLDFIQYEGLDINKLKFLMPYCKITNIDLSIPFIKYIDTYSIKTCCLFSMILCGNHIIENDDDINYELDTIIVRFADFEDINLYTMYFDFFKQTMKYIQENNQHIIDRDSLPVLEQFVIFDITYDKNLDGFFDLDDQTLTINFNKINEIPLTIGTKVSLTNQNRDKEENGNYTVIYVDDDKAILQLEKKKKIIDDPIHDPRYKCFEHVQITQPGLCLSDYDQMGKLKNTKTYWDRPCSSNKSCPFYQKNKNYKNYRGGCLDGFCELPIGMKQVSWRQFDKNSNPMCYNCKNNLDPFCCEEQKDRNKYPNLSSPDYVFPLDDIERMDQLKGNSLVKWYNY